MNNLDQYILGILVILLAIYFIVVFLLKKLGKDSHNFLPRNIASRIKFPLMVLLIALAIQAILINRNIITSPRYIDILQQFRSLMLILSITWFLIITIRIIKKQFLKRFDVTTSDNLRARKVYTQFNIIERIVVVIVIFFAIGIALLTFEGIKDIGVSLLTSAGIAGVILGLSAQKVIGSILAGIQIAISQPIRIDDVLIVEGEWGRVEEIKLTYVVVNIWDKRRLVLPTTYFIEKPFQNWTRNSSDILSTVFLYTDFYFPVDALREELTQILSETDLWDKKVNVIQVTDINEKGMELRVLVSARNSPIAWDLQVHVREQLINFIRKNYPESLPRTRVILKKDPSPGADPSDPAQRSNLEKNS